MPWFIPDRFTEDRCRRHGWWVLLALTALLYLPGLGTLPLMDRDEPRFAHATVEMMQRDAWVIPYFNSEPTVSDATRIQQMRMGKGAMEVGYRFDKPPLTYWWMRLHYHLLGINEFAARLHSVIATWLVALVTFGIASRLGGARAGIAAGIAWLTTLQVIVHGRLCVADMPMVFFVTLACWAVLECLVPEAEDLDPSSGLSAPTTPASFCWPWILHLSLGLGFLAKGPIALLVPGLALLLMRFAFWRKPLPWRRLKLWPGLLLTLAIIASWGIPALVETQGMYWKVGMQEHVVDRGTKAFNGRFPVPGYYLATAFLSLFPWICLLPMVWSRVRAKWDARMAFLVSWLAAPYIIFTLYATQLPHYVMPGFPAAMVLMVVCDIDFEKRSLLQKMWIGLVFFIVLLPLAVALVPAYLMPDAGFFWPIFLFVFGLAGFASSVVHAVWKSRWSAGLRLGFSLLYLSLLVVGMTLVCSKLRQIHPAAQLSAVAGPLPEKTELLGWQFNEPSLVYYFNHPWKFPNKLESVSDRMTRKGSRVVVLLRREWTASRALRDRLAGKAGDETENDFSKEVDAVIAAHPDYQVTNFDGLNAARGSWAELRMLVRR